jgi:gliding motility-associated-like protein
MKALSLIFTVWLVLLVTHVAVAQFPSNNGKFTADAIKGCETLKVWITNTPCADPTISCSYRVTRNGTTVKTGEFDNANTGLDSVWLMPAGTYNLFIAVGTDGVNNDDIRIDVSPNAPPSFEAYSCDGGDVFMKVTDTHYPFYIFDYSDGPTVTKPTVSATDIHTYTPAPATPTPRTVKVTGSNGPGANDASCLTKTATVTVANTLPVADIRRVEVLDPGTSIKVDFDTDPSIQYRFMVATNNATGFQQYATLYSDQATNMTQTVANVPALSNYYCMRVNTFNPCDNVVAGSSPIVCSLNLTATAQNNQNDLTWSTAAASAAHPLTDITITKNDAALSPNVAPTPAAYTDTNVTCKEQYTYRLTGNYTGGAQSLSFPKSVTAFSNNIPPAIADISALVDGTSVTLTWPEVAVPASTFSIVKTVNSVPGAAEEFTTLPFVDPAYATADPTCYRVTYTDRCGNTSLPSLDACPIQLGGSLRPDNTVDLTWSAYSGWTSPLSTYVVSLYDDGGNLLETTDAGNVTTFTDPSTNNPDNQVSTYIITARATDGTLDPSVSNTITLIKAPNLYYPTGFTPNRDGTNDTFRVFGQRYVVSFDMKIFNRWGEMMYSTNDKEDAGWDGTYKGSLQPEGTYVFRATVVDRAGRTFEKSGAFYLLRKK